MHQVRQEVLPEKFGPFSKWIRNTCGTRLYVTDIDFTVLRYADETGRTIRPEPLMILEEKTRYCGGDYRNYGQQKMLSIMDAGCRLCSREYPKEVRFCGTYYVLMSGSGPNDSTDIVIDPLRPIDGVKMHVTPHQLRQFINFETTLRELNS